MALVCDYCGGVLADGDKIAIGFDQATEIGYSSAKQWFYYCEGECAEAVHETLENLRRFAMHGEGSGLRWTLTDQKAPGKEKPVSEPTSESTSEPEADAAEPNGRSWIDGLSAYVPDPGPPTKTAQRKREARGTPIREVLEGTPRAAQRSALLKADLVTVEECAALSEVEFLGIPGVGISTLNFVKTAMDEIGVAFSPGPTKAQLANLLLQLREEMGLTNIHMLAAAVAEKVEVPEQMQSGHGRVEMTNAFEEIRGSLSEAEEGRKPPRPALLRALAELFGVDGPELLLAQAQALSAQP